MQQAFGYIRVSGKGQVDGDGFDRQRQAIEACASASGLQVVNYFQEEGVSGTKEDRPALARMLVDMEETPPYYLQSGIGYTSDTGLYGNARVGITTRDFITIGFGAAHEEPAFDQATLVLAYRRVL